MANMKYLRQSLILVLFGILSGCGGDVWLDPDTGLNLFQYLDRHGYTCYENHTVVTEDGYILLTVRIPRGRNEVKTNKTKPAVLLLHGLLSNPQDFFFQGDESIGFMLAEAGYDVYLMASRGTTYSTGHVNLSTNSAAYWNFSFHELGYYDIAANMDLITKLTGNQNMSFIGHSQGSTSFVVLAATRPEYRVRITASHLFAPVVHMTNVRLPFFDQIKQNAEQLEEALSDLHFNKDLLTYNPAFLHLTILFCSRDSPLLDLCIQVLGLLGSDPQQLNTSRLTVIASNDPAGCSVKQLLHYLQVAKSGKFRPFDYGPQNQFVYNQADPPAYNLTAINDIPVYVWYGLNDYFSGPEDYRQVVADIPSSIDKLVDNVMWNHVDFIFGSQAVDYVYKEVIRELCTYSSINNLLIYVLVSLRIPAGQ